MNRPGWIACITRVLPWSLSCLLLLSATGLAQNADAAKPKLTLDGLRAMRKHAAERRRRAWLNHDGCDAFSFRGADLKGRKATPQDLLDVRTTPLAGTHVDTLSYCTISSGFSNFTHRTKVGHTLVEDSPSKGRINITQHLLDQGTDPLQVMIDFCRRHDMEIFWSMRMNDTHDGASKPGKPHFLLPQLKKDHPEYMIGTFDNRPRHGAWTSVDYGLPVIRDMAFHFIEEVCQDYDVDGVEFDFFRHLSYFKTVAYGGQATPEERDAMTALMRRVRAMTEREGIRRGWPILIAMRVPDSAEYSKAMGLDIERWMAEGLIDCAIGSGYLRLNRWDYWVKLCQRYRVQAYAGMSESRIREDRSTHSLRRSDESYRARSANAWRAGVDGIYIFNEYNARRLYLKDVGDPDGLKKLPKTYFPTIVNRNPESYLTGGSAMLRLPMLSSANVKAVTEATSVTVPIELTEDFSWTAASPAKPEVVCRLQVDGLDRAEDALVKLNDQPLTNGRLAHGWLTFELAPSQIHNGINNVELSLTTTPQSAVKAGPPWDVVYTGDKVMRMPTQLPWRRLFQNRDWTEEVRDGALFLADRGAGPDDWTHLAYPWVVTPRLPVAVEARVKVAASTDPLAVCIRVANGQSVEYVTLQPDRIGLQFAGLSAAMDTTDAFHTYRIEVKGKDIRVFADDRLKLDGRGRFTTSAADPKHWLNLLYGKRTWNRSCLLFGSASGPGKGEAYWEFIRFSGKAKCVTWRDLLVSVAFPVRAPKIDRWDVAYSGRALPAKPWRGPKHGKRTRAEVRGESLLIADQGKESGDYLYFAYPWQASPKGEAVVEAQVKLLSGWAAIIVANGQHHEQIYIHPDTVKLRHGGLRHPMDTTDRPHLYRVAITGDAIRVYVDGKLRLDGAGRLKHAAPKGGNNVSFGGTNSPSVGEALWDFVRIRTAE